MASQTETGNKHLRILVVEDDADMREALMVGLANDNTHLHGAANPADALEIFKKNPIDLLITDIRMPGTRDMPDGMELAAEVNMWARLHNRQYKCIVITGFPPDEIDAAMDGVDAVLQKPVEWELLAYTIEELTGVSVKLW